MSKPSHPFAVIPSLIAFALLAACASREPLPPPVAIAPQGGNDLVQLRPGPGRIEAVARIPDVESASAGGSGPLTLRRLVVRMRDGSVQQVDTPADGFSVGEQVEIGADGYLRRRAP